MIFSHDDEVVIAQCTPKGSGAIALLRISGLGAIEVVARMSKLPSGTSMANVSTHTIHYGFVVDANGAHIDQVMFIVMRGPKTFTGQDVVEITCHNNPFIIQNIIEQALAHGARLAKEGEFTKRAVLNNKIDIIQAEAINELINANTQEALKRSLAQLGGSFSNLMSTLEKKLVKALAFSEASFEFIDEEMSFGAQIKEIIAQTLATITNIKKTFDQQVHIRQGIRVAIVGSVNAGKSSLFNALLNKDRAIVTNIAGTTRDSLEAGLYKDGAYWTLIDTAGLRQTFDTIEQAGIKRSEQEAQQADIVLLVIDSSRAHTAEEKEVYDNMVHAYSNKIIVVHNKTDIKTESAQLFAEYNPMQVSSKNAQGLQFLEEAIAKKTTALLQGADSPFLLNQRQFNLLLGLEKRLLSLVESLQEKTIHYELLSYHLNDALAHVSELTGKTISEQGMDAVFREFCVGK